MIGLLSTIGLFISPPLYLSLPLILYKTKFNPILSTLLVALGMSVGDTIGYFIGFSSEKLLENKIYEKERYKKFSEFINKYGPITIPLLSALPFPFFDALAIACGFAKIDIKSYFIYLFFGRLIKVSLIVIAGQYILIRLPFEI